MSLLANNTDALARVAGLDRSAIEEKAGTLPETEGRVLAALYNADTEGKMNMLLHSNPAGIVAGLAVADLDSGAVGVQFSDARSDRTGDSGGGGIFI